MARTRWSLENIAHGNDLPWILPLRLPHLVDVLTVAELLDDMIASNNALEHLGQVLTRLRRPIEVLVEVYRLEHRVDGSLREGAPRRHARAEDGDVRGAAGALEGGEEEDSEERV